MRSPLFRDRPTLRPPRAGASRRLLLLLAPTRADLRGVRRLARALAAARVHLIAASECHGEVRGEHREALMPEALLVEAIYLPVDGVVVAGGEGARRVAEDPFARMLLTQAGARGVPIGALGLACMVLERAGLRGRCTRDPRALAAWLVEQLGLAGARAAHAQPLPA
jgi:hypothetical protein